MNKVFVFGVDEDSLVFDIEYDSLDAYFKDHGEHYCGIFLDEYIIDEVQSVTFDDDTKVEIFDFDGGDIELEKFENLAIKYNTFLKENSEYILVSFGIEYDSSWLLIDKNDYNELLKMAKKLAELENKE
jgi:hypothetical protein